MVPSRYVYLFHPDWPAQGRWRVRNTLNRDRKMLAKSGYRILRHEELGEQHVERIVALYNALYLDKYSQHNPQFSVEFVRLAMQKRTLTLIGLEKDGRLDGILGYFERNGVMTTPLFGYDTTLPKETGLYRMLSCLLVLEAESKGILLHQSAGVGAFKADRGAEGEPEYTAVYVKHLPFYRQAVWKVLAILLNRIGVKMVEKYQL
nr:GNAT family N-acetyltransferase [Brevibacillus formosus]